MPEKHSVAVLFAFDPNSPSPGGAPPSEQQLKHVLDTGPNSVRNFWADNVPYIDVTMTVFSRVTINPDRTPPPGASGRNAREMINIVAQTVSQNLGVDTSVFDHLFVVVHGGDGFGFAAHGSDAFVRTDNDFSTICHEFGHCLGFDHSHGFVKKNGVIWSEDYRSPYDVMAGLWGTYQLGLQDALPPGLPLAGPMIARAVVHYDKPAALTETGKVLEIDLFNTPKVAEVWAAGRGGPGQPELLVFHTEGDRGNPKHKLMIEYRQPDPSLTGPSRWDQALDGRHNNAPGIVVYTIHTAKLPDGTDAYDRPHYTARLSLEAIDFDVDVVFPWGTYTIALNKQGGLGNLAPDHVQVTVGHAPLGPAKVRIIATSFELSVIPGTVKQIPPNLPPFWGPQEYIVNNNYTRWNLEAYVSNLNSPIGEDITFEWTVEGIVIPADEETHFFRSGQFFAEIYPGTQMLKVGNSYPLSEMTVVLVKVKALDYGTGVHLTSTIEISFDRQRLEPGEALQRLLTWYDLKFRRRFPKPGPRRPNLLELQRLRFAYLDLERADPQLAALVKPLMDEEEALWSRQLIEDVAQRLIN